MRTLLWSGYTILILVVAACVTFAVLGASVSLDYLWGLLVFVPLAAVGFSDLLQTRHAILRNYPVIGHMRFVLEAIRPELRQYLIEDERDPVPFSREQRALVYRRAKNVDDKQPFGTVRDVNAHTHGWINHSILPVQIEDADFRVTIGGSDCRQPYSASIINISGTSFGAVSGNAIMALNKGAKLGGFAHNTGEGSISPYHRRHGGDIIWQVASGYFGCRTPEGRFDPEAFARQAASDQVKMIEIKLSQGAKPGHGGVLPKAKITEEIAQTRGVPRDRDCVSPVRHSEFSTPIELMGFIARLRELSGGKPIGLKMCVGHRYEFMALAKAMIETGVAPDFITIDGAEGGTGAAPLELVNNVGMPMVDALAFTHNTLVGAGVRHRTRLAASGKIVSGYDVCRAFALGADYVNIARGFMFSVGCIQSRACHTNQCPTGVATQSQWRQRALVVDDKAARVANFHHNTLHAVAEVVGAAGLYHPEDLRPHHLHMRGPGNMVTRADRIYDWLEEGALIDGTADKVMREEWDRAQAAAFAPTEIGVEMRPPEVAAAPVS
ncbi:MAG TPA: FMN-binding glutamate synthase family protein [Phenylobacterium sp.]|jgi:glutamate synthase domain-containing protein 2|uniref:FMN-binding glutamate synthase family protein n=1 Tax=Phenylobacterium sp. TaxID=1871053 RepID=UPI002D4C409E|nr:FMN-binding glutamate synthase family protein [Phenylobacterium sp.]HZZ70343.1 FMN-binding glutamate synthase family protein [Phenylobacterium sp.]